MPITSPRASVRYRSSVPEDWDDDAEHRRMLAEAIQELKRGLTSNTGSVTLETSGTTTTVNDNRVHGGSAIVLIPSTQTAAGELGFWVSSYGEGTFTITHGVNASVDRTFQYIIFG